MRPKFTFKNKGKELPGPSRHVDQAQRIGGKGPMLNPRDVAVKNAPTTGPKPPTKKRYKSRMPQSLREIRKYQKKQAATLCAACPSSA